jgi:hypothetical protein
MTDDKNEYCSHHGDISSEQKIINARVITQGKKINDLCARTRVLETTCIFDVEHQRTLGRLEKIQDAQAEMRETFLNAITDIKIANKENNVKIALIIASLVFILQLIAQYLVKVY